MSPIETTDILKENKSLKSEITFLKEELAYLKRQIFGQKTEKYVSPDIQTSWLTDENDSTSESPQTITYERLKKKKKHPGREEIPAHVPRVVEVLEPDCDTTDMEKVTEKKTEQLEYKPAEFYVRQIVRPVYLNIANGDRKFICAKLPSLCIDKGKAGASLVAHTLVAKGEDHMPLYRILNQIKRDCGLILPKSSVEEWFNAGCFWISALSNRINEMIMDSSYIQIDESFLKVMVKPTEGKSTQGYMWVKHCPENKLVSFTFDKKRNTNIAQKMIGSDFKGTVQSDGLSVYEFMNEHPTINHAGCNGHGRRYFEKSLGSDKKRADYALRIYQKIFEVEREAKDKEFSWEQRLMLRKEKTVPIMDDFKQWLDEEELKVLPKSNIGKAIAYVKKRWKELTAFLEDGRIEISNNLIENLIRPLALGRRNWLFAGSPKGAQRLADLYTITLTCKSHGVNLFRYLSNVLKELPMRELNNIDDLLPNKWVDPDQSFYNTEAS
jgi:transposase